MANLSVKQKKFGIVGLGMVGNQLKLWLESRGHRVFAYDKFKESDPLESLDKADIIFLCLPTPHVESSKTGINLAVFRSTIKAFKKPKIFVIKSTVPPGTTDQLQKLFPRHEFFHNPEFLTESTARQDFLKPGFQLIGHTDKSKRNAASILKILPPAQHSNILPAVGTELFKYARNSFFATKVIFANQIYDLCGSHGIDYGEIEKLMAADPWIGGNHLQIFHKNYRGFGGKCLPKDLKTFITAFRAKKLQPSLLEAADRTNDKLLRKQGLHATLKNYWLNNRNN